MAQQGMTDTPKIVIVGAGPAACTLACLLAQRGVEALVYDDGKRPDLLVGESLIPAVIPILRSLGIEERVAAISMHKPGVSFLHDHVPWIHFNFAPVKPYLPTYAYNVDRKAFDTLLKERARELGATFIPHRAKVVRPADGRADRLELDAASVAAAPQLGGKQPDLLVDATGRNRLFSKLLDLKATAGKRSDTAYFAHYTDFVMPEPAGQVLISRLSQGWSWRIPLSSDRMSFGVVIDKEAARRWGESPEERIEHALKSEPLHRLATANARRITPVMVYNNYQLIAERAFGPGWALVGDALGFVDPMLSSGLFLAMESARCLDARLFPNGVAQLAAPDQQQRELSAYQQEMRTWYEAWSDLIDGFYDGRIFSLYEAGYRMRMKRDNWLQHALDRSINKHIACMASGALTRARFSRVLVQSACRFLSYGVSPAAKVAIR